MNDLPNYLPGIPPMYGVKQESPAYSQGNDVVIEFELLFDDCPLRNPDNWKLEVFVKKGVRAQNILWKGELGVGLYQLTKNSGTYYFRIPAFCTSWLVPGTYFFAVRGTQKPVTGDKFDLVTTLHQGSFEIELDASSPNPRLMVPSVIALFYDPVTAKYIETMDANENTEPLPETVISL